MQDDVSGSASRRNSSSTRRHARAASRSSLLDSSAEYLEEARHHWPPACIPRRETLMTEAEARPSRRSTGIIRKVNRVDRAKNNALTSLPQMSATTAYSASSLPRPLPSSLSCQQTVRPRFPQEERRSLASRGSRVPSLPDSEALDDVLSEHENVARSIRTHKSSFSTDSTAPTLHLASAAKPTFRSQARAIAWRPSTHPTPAATRDSGVEACIDHAGAHRRQSSGCSQSSLPQRPMVNRKPVPAYSDNGSLPWRNTKESNILSCTSEYPALFVPKALMKELPPLCELVELRQLEQFVLLAGFLSLLVVDSQANMQTRLNRLSYLSKEHRARTEAIKRNEDRIKRLCKEASDTASTSSKDSTAPLPLSARWFSKKHRRASDSSSNGNQSDPKTARADPSSRPKPSIKAIQVNTAHHVVRVQAITIEKTELQTSMKDGQIRFGELLLLEHALRDFLASSDCSNMRGTGRPVAETEDEALSIAVKHQKESTMRCRQHERRYTVVIECEDHLSEAILSAVHLQEALYSLARSIEAQRANGRNHGSGKARLVTQKELNTWQALHEECRDRWQAAWSCIEFNFRSLRTKATALLSAGQIRDAAGAGHQSLGYASNHTSESQLSSVKKTINACSEKDASSPSCDSLSGKLLRIRSQPDLRGVTTFQQRATFDPERLSNAYRCVARHRPNTATIKTSPAVPPNRTPATYKRMGSKDSNLTTCSFHTAADTFPVDASARDTAANGELALAGSPTVTVIPSDVSFDRPDTVKESDTVEGRWISLQTMLLASIVANLAPTSSTSTLLSLSAPPLFPPVGVHLDFVRHYQSLLASLETGLSALRGMWDELILKWEEHGDYLGEQVVAAMKRTDLAKAEYWTQVGTEIVRDILSNSG